MLGALSQVLAQLVAEGRLARNVAVLVDRVPGKTRQFETFTADQVHTVLGGIANDRNRHAWHLALAGLRRGEIAGLRWDDVDLGQRTVRIGKTRVDVGGRALGQDDPETASAGRVLPIPDALLSELAAAKARHAAERLALCEAYVDLGYVVCNEAGEPYHPSTLSTMWQAAIKNLTCRRYGCTTPGIPAPPSCICRACPSRWWRPGWAMPTCRSPFARTFMPNRMHSDSRRAALLRRLLARENEPFAHSCGDINQFLVPSVTILDVIERVLNRKK